MRFNFRMGEQFESFVCMIEVDVDGAIQKSRVEMPVIFLQQEFLSLVSQASASHQKVKVKMTRTEPVWDQYDQRYIEVERAIEFANNAYVAAHEDEFKEEV